MTQAMQVAFLASKREMTRSEIQDMLNLSPAELRAAFKRLEQIAPDIERDQ